MGQSRLRRSLLRPHATNALLPSPFDLLRHPKRPHHRATTITLRAILIFDHNRVSDHYLPLTPILTISMPNPLLPTLVTNATTRSSPIISSIFITRFRRHRLQFPPPIILNSEFERCRSPSQSLLITIQPHLSSLPG